MEFQEATDPLADATDPLAPTKGKIQSERTAQDELERAKTLIRNLHTKATNTGVTEDEALLFADKVGELLRQFDLTLTDVIITQERCLQREVFAADDAMCSVITGIGRLCALVTYHKSGSTPTTYVLFGMERDVELAVFLYEICAEACDVGWGEHINQGLGHTKKQRESFRAGFAYRIFSRMEDMKFIRDQEREKRMAAAPGGRDLVLVRDAVVLEEFKRTGVRLRSRSVRTVTDRKAYSHGYDHGDSVNLRSPIEGRDDPELLG